MLLIHRLCESFPAKSWGHMCSIKRVLHGTGVAMYIVGQERRLVDPPSQVVAGVRTVTTNMDGRDALPRMSRPFAFKAYEGSGHDSQLTRRYRVAVLTRFSLDCPKCTAWKSH